MPRRASQACALLITGAAAAAAAAQAPTEPQDTAGIGIFEHVGDRVPPDLTFTDESGREVALSECFDGEHPVLLTLVYYTCPGICNALLNGLTQTLGEMEWTAGDQFRIVTVSIDPSESPDLAAAKKASYLEFYGREPAADGWRFMTGRQENITKLADAVGFGYRYEPGTGLFTHAATLMVCTPDGRLSRYLNDVVFEPRTLELALTEASRGNLGSPVSQLLVTWCYTYDPSSGKYVVAARTVMSIGGAVTVLLTAAGLGLLWWRERRRKPAGAEASA